MVSSSSGIFISAPTTALLYCKEVNLRCSVCIMVSSSHGSASGGIFISAPTTAFAVLQGSELEVQCVALTWGLQVIGTLVTQLRCSEL